MRPLQRPRALALVAGLCVGAGHVPLSLWPLALVGVAGLFALIARSASPREGALRALIFGIGHFALALSWIVEPFLVDPLRHGWMAPFALVAMAGGMAGFWAAGVWLALRLVPGPGGLRPLAAALGLAVAEVVRSHLFGGFPWALIGHLWIDTPILQVASLVGAHGLGLLTLAAGLGLAPLITPRASTSGRASGRAPRRLARAAAGVAAGGAAGVAALGLPWALGLWLGALPVPPSPAAGPFAPAAADAPAEGPDRAGAAPQRQVIVRLVQPGATQAIKWDPAARLMLWQRLLAATSAPLSPAIAGAVGAEAAGARPDLVVWPESAVPFLLDNSAPERAEIARAAGGAEVFMGIQRTQELRFFNAMALIDAAGEVRAVYDKYRLVPFGEFIPYGDLLARRFGITAFAAQEGAGFTPGPGARVIDSARAGRLLPLICYEAVFPAAIHTAPTRPDVLVQATNDAWFGRLNGPYQHLALARLRAVEFGLPVLRAANTGVSAVIDARGRVIARLDLGAQGHLDAVLPPSAPPTPYARLGDWPAHLVLLAGILGMLAARRRPGGPQAAPKPH